MQYEFILMAIPIIIIVAFLVLIAKRMTDGERPDISGAVLGTIIIAVGLLIMVPIISSVDPQYEYDDEDKTFTLYKNVTGTEFSWGSAADAESLIIEDTVTTISAGAFASFTDLKYISIPDSLETIGEGAFPTLKDYMNQTIAEPEAGEYVGTGDGTLYLADESIFRYSTDGKAITGLTADAESAKNLVIPISHNGVKIEAVNNSSFTGNTSIERVMALPGEYSFRALGTNVFNGNTSLVEAILPDSMTTLNYRAFFGCTSLETVSIPSVTTIGNGVFQGCTILDIQLPSSLAIIGNSAFANCSGLTDLYFSSTLETLESYSFNGCTGVASVTFAPGFAPTALDSNAFRSWTFYDSDGITTIDKTVASNLAGFTFQGTAAALVKVLPDRSALTLEQTLKVQELTKAAAKASKLEEAELQISEKTKLAEA